MSIASCCETRTQLNKFPSFLSSTGVDIHRFHSLDRIITPRKWVPAVRQVYSKRNTGSPSDHYMLKVKLQVKLGAALPKTAKPPMREYQVDSGTKAAFDREVTAHLRSTPPLSPSSTLPIQIFTIRWFRIEGKMQGLYASRLGVRDHRAKQSPARS